MGTTHYVNLLSLLFYNDYKIHLLLNKLVTNIRFINIW